MTLKASELKAEQTQFSQSFPTGKVNDREKNAGKKVNIPFNVNISLSVHHNLAILVKNYIMAKGKYLENIFQEARNNEVSNYSIPRVLRSAFYRVINMVHEKLKAHGLWSHSTRGAQGRTPRGVTAPAKPCR